MQMAEAIHRFINLFEGGSYFRNHRFIALGHSMGNIGLILSTTLLPPLRFEHLIMVETNMAPFDSEYVSLLKYSSHKSHFILRKNGAQKWNVPRSPGKTHGNHCRRLVNRFEQTQGLRLGMTGSSVYSWFEISLISVDSNFLFLTDSRIEA
jgi:hypothetical protein